MRSLSRAARLQRLARYHGLAPDGYLLQKSSLILEHVVSPGTRNTYNWYFGKFRQWCTSHSRCSLPADVRTVKQFFLDLSAEYTPQTLRHFAISIKMIHLRSGYADPTTSYAIRSCITERLRRIGESRPKQVLYVDDLMRTVSNIGTSLLTDLRDRALLLTAYFAPLQLRQMRTLVREHIIFRNDDMCVLFPNEKRTSLIVPRGAQGRFCAVQALYTYLQSASIRVGPVFVDCRYKVPGRVALTIPPILKMIRKRCASAGVTYAQSLTTDSLMRGFIVTGHEAGMRFTELMLRTGMKAAAIRRYRKFVRPSAPYATSFLGI